MPVTHTFTANTTIAAGQQDSEAVTCDLAELIAVQFPASMTGSTVTLYADAPSGTGKLVCDPSGTPITIPVVTSAQVLTPLGIRCKTITLHSNAVETADRTLGLVFQE